MNHRPLLKYHIDLTRSVGHGRCTNGTIIKLFTGTEEGVFMTLDTRYLEESKFKLLSKLFPTCKQMYRFSRNSWGDIILHVASVLFVNLAHASVRESEFEW